MMQHISHDNLGCFAAGASCNIASILRCAPLGDKVELERTPSYHVVKGVPRCPRIVRQRYQCRDSANKEGLQTKRMTRPVQTPACEDDALEVSYTLATKKF